MSREVSVLIIDDDRGTCETVGEVLRAKGYAVETATRGKDGLDKLAALPFDAGIVDIKLPDISGLDLLRAMKERSPEVEVVFITGFASLATAIQAINGAAYAYITKPFEMDHLLAILEKALEKQRLARALRESEERYRLITENTSDAIFLLDLDGTIRFANKRIADLTGYSPEELRGQPIFSLLTPEGAAQGRARLAAIRAGREIPPFHETEVVRNDGRRVPVEANFTSVLREGQVVGRLGVVRDITERKRLQEQLIQAEKLATLGELIAGIAHELNNPLAAMVGHAQLLRASQQDPAVAARADRIVEAARRATRIVRNFLTFARKHRPEKAAVSVNEVIARTHDLLSYQLRVANVEVQTDLDPSLPAIAADPYQLQQVVLNLLNNAWQAMAAAGGQGTLRIGSTLTPDRRSVRVTVADDGPGILPEHLPHIFDPFFTTKAAGEGTGLGLPIARGIVAEHSGTLTVESEPGRGAAFVVTLPIGEAPAPPAPAPVPAAIPAGLHVLVVDDEPALLELMAEALAGRGCRVETASSGREALERLSREGADVAVLDLRMPEMPGTEVWKEISRTNPALARRTVFCTGDVVTEKTRAFLVSTGCLTVSKPFELSQFLDAVAEAASR